MTNKKSKDNHTSESSWEDDKFKFLSRAEDDGFPISKNLKKDIVELCEDKKKNDKNDSGKK